MRHVTLALLLLACGFRALAGNAADLRQAIGERAPGFIQMNTLMPLIFRQATLVWDGEFFRLMMVGLPTIVLDPGQAKHNQVKHPDGEWMIDMVSWHQPQLDYLVDIMIRPPEVLAHENQKLYQGHFKTLPRVIVGLRNKHTQMMEGQGGFFGDDQDKSALDDLIDMFTNAGAQVLTMDRLQDAQCDTLLKGLIRVRK